MSGLDIAIIGAGRMAREHILAFSGLAGVRLAGIASRTPERAEALAREFSIPLVAATVDELYERTRAQLAVVAVSSESMCEVACRCCDFPWSAFLEKPLGYNLAQGDAICAAARRSQTKIWVALNRRFYSSTSAALDDLDQRPGPRYIQVLDELDPPLTASYGHPREIMESLMYFSSIHLVDYFQVFGRGEILSVRPIFRYDAAHPFAVSAAIEFASGDQGLYQAVWDAPGPWAVAVNTREVRWEMRPLEKATVQKRGERRSMEIETALADQQFKPGFRVQAEQVVAAALGRPSRSPTLEDAMKTMRLVGRIYFQELSAVSFEATR